MIRQLILLLFLFSTATLSAENPSEVRSWTVSGYVRDAATGEELIGANVYVKKLSTGTIANQYGYYSLTLAPGHYEITYSYIGYGTVVNKLNLDSDTVLNVYLAENTKQLEEVVVSTRQKNHNITSVQTGSVELPIQAIRNIPAFMGEVDVIKAIQMLPGVQAAAEGSSGFTVRGGGTDQNLVLLDEATVYNASHLLGFFSVFNNDAIKDVTLYKGDIPASSGGRLSSLL
ncbi:MAG TPA: carboxypeptidase-like regulatory domain-containing protein, partial [Bacteroidales bacterium]|nr:carboxypeptidase-like regulatory domain-containing protein [Bacteroidales bacterium]